MVHIKSNPKKDYLLGSPSVGSAPLGLFFLPEGFLTFGTLGAFPLVDFGDLEDLEDPSPLALRGPFGFSEAALGSTTDLAAERGSMYQQGGGLKTSKPGYM